MDEGGKDQLTARARRRREEVPSGGLSVADLLARHTAEGGGTGAGASRRSAHRLRDEPNEPVANDYVGTEGPLAESSFSTSFGIQVGAAPGADFGSDDSPGFGSAPEPLTAAPTRSRGGSGLPPELPEPALAPDDDHSSDADRRPRRAMDDFPALVDYRRRPELPGADQGHTDQLFARDTLSTPVPATEQTNSLLNVLDQIGLPRIAGYEQPIERTAPTRVEPADRYRPAPLFTDPSEVARPSTGTNAAPSSVEKNNPSRPEPPPMVVDYYGDDYYGSDAVRDYSAEDYYRDERPAHTDTPAKYDTNRGLTAEQDRSAADVHPRKQADRSGPVEGGADLLAATGTLAGASVPDLRGAHPAANLDGGDTDSSLAGSSIGTDESFAGSGTGRVDQPVRSADAEGGGTESLLDPASKPSVADRTAHIDQTLSRLTAIHAGLSDDMTDRVSGSTRLAKLGSTRRGAKRGAGRTEASNRGDDLVGVEAADRGADKPARSAIDKIGGRFSLGRRTTLVALSAAAALLLVVGLGFGTNLWLNDKLQTVEALDSAAPGVVDAAAQSGDQNYLIVLSDSTDRQAPVSNGVENVLLAHVPAARDRAVLVSAPANVLIDRLGCQRYNADASYSSTTVPGQSGVPLSSAYRYGGPRCILAQMQQLTGLAINHFMTLDLGSVREMVDAEGGLSLCVPKPVVDDSLGVIAPNPGKQMLGGDASLSYARAWHVRGEADGAGQLDGQALRQQLLLSALLAKVNTSPLLHLPTLASVVGVLGANSLMDGMTLGMLGQLSNALRSTDQTKVDFVNVPTAGQPDARGDEVLDADAAKSLFTAVRTDRALPGEGANALAPSTADAVSATTTMPPGAVTVTVRNGSSHAGMANKAADSLRGLGFTVAGVSQAPHQPGGRTVIRASADQSAQADALSGALPDAKVDTVPGTGTLELVIGDSFNGQVSATPTANSTTPALLTAAQLSCH